MRIRLPKANLVNTRRLAQGLFLLLFLFLFIQTETKGADRLGYPAKIFLDWDPLLFLSTLLSGRVLVPAMLWSLLLLGLTAVFGRFFCGWICPLGTLNNLVGALKKWKPRTTRVRGWFALKYWLLAGLLGGSIFGLQLTGIFDPLSMLERSLTIGVYPGFNKAVNAAADAAYATNLKPVADSSEFLFGLLKKTVLAFQQPYYHQGLIIAACFAAVLLLNLVERRFWCRYLCPLGALLGAASRFALLKRETAEGCNGCGACDTQCQGGLTPAKGETWMPTECFYCGNCDDVCPRVGVAWNFVGKPAPQTPDVGRRNLLLAGATGVTAAALSRSTSSFDPERPDALLIRPPGAREETEFLARCVKCGACMKVCPTNALQPATLEHGSEALWTPTLVPKAGWCEYNCTLCGQVCPTGAIQKLSQEQKRPVKIGTAMFDKNRCLPYAHATPCIVCEEHCPTPTKAIWFENVVVKDRNGNPVPVMQPHVDLALCNGCGICEAKCPIQDRPGVTVSSIAETRSKRNQLILGTLGGGYS
jgi:polyferredoxin